MLFDLPGLNRSGKCHDVRPCGSVVRVRVYPTTLLNRTVGTYLPRYLCTYILIERRAGTRKRSSGGTRKPETGTHTARQVANGETNEHRLGSEPQSSQPKPGRVTSRRPPLLELPEPPPEPPPWKPPFDSTPPLTEGRTAVCRSAAIAQQPATRAESLFGRMSPKAPWTANSM